MDDEELNAKILLLRNKSSRLNGILGFGQDQGSLLLTLEILTSEETAQFLERYRLLRTYAQRAGIPLDSEQYGRLYNLSVDMRYGDGRCELVDLFEAFKQMEKTLG